MPGAGRAVDTRARHPVPIAGSKMTVSTIERSCRSRGPGDRVSGVALEDIDCAVEALKAPLVRRGRGGHRGGCAAGSAVVVAAIWVI
jgi:hypothetical protein